MANPNPDQSGLEKGKWKPGQSGNPAGKPPGSKHLSTIIQELAENIDWDLTNLKDKDKLKAKYGKQGFKALVYVAHSKAMAGDVQAMNWLAKNGYGEKIKLEVDDPRRAILRQYMEDGDAGEAEEAPSGPPADTA